MRWLPDWWWGNDFRDLPDIVNLAPDTDVYAASLSRQMMQHSRFKTGKIIADDAPITIADGLKVPLKENTWHFVSNLSLMCRPRASRRSSQQ